VSQCRVLVASQPQAIDEPDFLCRRQDVEVGAEQKSLHADPPHGAYQRFRSRRVFFGRVHVTDIKQDPSEARIVPGEIVGEYVEDTYVPAVPERVAATGMRDLYPRLTRRRQ
jgi:hypothetical protein